MHTSPVNTPGPRTQAAERQVVEFARRLLTPVARILVGKLPLELISNVLKECIIRAAREKIAREQPAKRVTKSAVALMVGIDTRSVAADDEPDQAGYARKAADPMGQLVEAWATHSQWLDEKTGRPLDLPAYGSGQTFQQLVRQVIGRSISYSEVMEVLLNEGNIKRVDKRRLRLVSDRFSQREPWTVPRARLLPFLGDMSYCLGLNIQSVLEKPTHDPDDPHIAGLVHNRDIPAASMPALKREISGLMIPRGFEVDQALRRHQNTAADGHKFSAGMGWFYWEEPQD